MIVHSAELQNSFGKYLMLACDPKRADGEMLRGTY